MTDPRAENCLGYAETNGKTTGVRLEFLPAPETKYELIRATLVDEVTAQGNIVATVQVLDKDNIAARVNCYLAWPWRGWQFPQGFQDKLLPGNPNLPYQHMITNKYNPGGFGPSAEPGPLAVYIGDSQGNVISDVIGGLGLPGGRHVSYDLVFRERTAGGSTGGGTGGGGTGGTGGGDLAAQLQRIEEKLDRLMMHLNVPE